jgi:hypothetical protein
MHCYIAATLDRLQHSIPLRPQFAPHQWTQPAYGQKLQLDPIDESPKLEKNRNPLRTILRWVSPLLCTSC